MPITLRRSGPSFERNGETIEPRAAVYLCEGCGGPASHGEGVALLRGIGGRWWCGMVDGQAVCIQKTTTGAAE